MSSEKTYEELLAENRQLARELQGITERLGLARGAVRKNVPRSSWTIITLQRFVADGARSFTLAELQNSFLQAHPKAGPWIQGGNVRAALDRWQRVGWVKRCAAASPEKLAQTKWTVTERFGIPPVGKISAAEARYLEFRKEVAPLETH